MTEKHKVDGVGRGGDPMLHVVLGACFFAAFCWPFLVFDKPVFTWAYLYLLWAASIAMIFALQRFSRSQPKEALLPENSKQLGASRSSDV